MKSLTDQAISDFKDAGVTVYFGVQGGACARIVEAVTNNNCKNGTLKFVLKSHNRFIKTKSKKRDNLYSEQFNCSISKDEKKLIKDFISSFGDIGIFHMNLKHRSGKNISKKFRLTIGCRFHDTSKNFNVGKEMYYFNKSKSIYLKKN